MYIHIYIYTYLFIYIHVFIMAFDAFAILRQRAVLVWLQFCLELQADAPFLGRGSLDPLEGSLIYTAGVLESRIGTSLFQLYPAPFKVRAKFAEDFGEEGVCDTGPKAHNPNNWQVKDKVPWL